tara:strand:+ start:113 stop:487 length:375 start_codon:yes stop_codon:yes gene_type:complete
MESYQKEYSIKNQEKLKAYQKEYRLKNRDKLLLYKSQNKEKLYEQNKLYYEKNKVHRDKINKEYRIKNREKLTQKHKCMCGGRYTYQNRLTHFNTKKHKFFISTTLENENDISIITKFYKQQIK